MLQHTIALALLITITSFSTTLAQESEAETPKDPQSKPSFQDQSEQAFHDTKEKAEEFAKQVDESEQAAEIKAGILDPIYQLAEYMAFPTFHWIAFAVMVTGVVSFALQLVLAKLVLLMRMGISMTAILSDALGLLISVIGLVLTTQAAAENSTFTNSSAVVLSSAIVGALVGIVFYWWGQSQEWQAAKGRTQL